jgi:hypothetical protein
VAAKTNKATKPAAAPQSEIRARLKRRFRVALEATYQMDALFDAVGEQISRINTADDMDIVAVIQALAIRGAALSSAAMSVLGDEGIPSQSEDDDSIESLEKVVMTPMAE